MIIRVVKMTFAPDKLGDFLKLFTEVKNKIQHCEGCQHLELLQDTYNTSVIFTYSHWETEAQLEKYRKSELFKTTWAKTKILFADKPEAWSVEGEV